MYIFNSDCIYSESSKSACEKFLASTLISCPRRSCSEGAVNKTCDFELRRVPLDVNSTVLRCAMGTARSKPFVLNVQSIASIYYYLLY